MAKQYVNNEGVERRSGGLKVLRAVDAAFDNLFLIVLVLVLLCASYVVYDNGRIIKGANSVQYEQYKPHDTASFAELQQKNSEVSGWVEVFGTGIDYPVAQTDNNFKYVNTSVYDSPSIAGAIYLDYRNSRDLSDFNSILYGHHMDESAMFGDIDKFESAEFFESHAYGEIYTSATDRYYGIELFAYVLGDAYDEKLYNPYVESEDEKQAYIDYVYSIAYHSRDIEIGADDRLVVLSTCASEPTNGRHLLVGKLSDDRFENSFASENRGSGLGDLFDRFPHDLALVALCVIAIIVVSLLIYAIKRRERKRKEAQTKRD